MYGGRYIGLLFPNNNWGTHCAINREAYSLLIRSLKKKWRINIRRDLAPLREINFFEDFNGVDGLWLAGKWNSSTMYYNPINGQGEAPQGIKHNFLILQKILTKKRNQINLLRSAKRSAFLSHLVADCLNPPHQFGRYYNSRIRYLWWMVKQDWHEDSIANVKTGVTLEYLHRKFETKMLYKFLNKKFGAVKIYHGFIQQYQSQKNNNPFLLPNKIIGEIENVFKLRIYQQYIKRGWTEYIEKTMLNKVMPLIISWVATFWLLALLESKNIKY